MADRTQQKWNPRKFNLFRELTESDKKAHKDLILKEKAQAMRELQHYEEYARFLLEFRDPQTVNMEYAEVERRMEKLRDSILEYQEQEDEDE